MDKLNEILEKYVAMVDAHEPIRNTISGKINRLEFSKTLHNDLGKEIDQECTRLKDEEGFEKEDLKKMGHDILQKFLNRVAL